MIEATQRKLREAEFFYKHLAGPVHVPDPEAFRFYFSAFIAAARSIAWVLQAEEKEKYDAWKPEWDKHLTPEQRKLEKLTNELRLDETKRRGVEVLVQFEEVALHEIMALGERFHDHPAYRQSSAAPPGPGDAGREATFVFRATRYLENEDGKVEAISLCKQYLGHLEKLVGDFLKAHAHA
jgi:hypothetical protein